VLAAAGSLFDVSQQDDFLERLPTIHRALYLLFNQGYHGGSTDAAVQPLLCREAMRLMAILLEHPFGRTTTTFALAALMQLNAARLPTKLDSSGELIQLSNQDRSLWDREMIWKGTELLAAAATGEVLTDYHIEALLAEVHASASRIEDTDWGSIVQLYDALLILKPSPVVALNRAIAISQLAGAKRGLDEISRISDAERLEEYPFYWAARGELLALAGEPARAIKSFERALGMARNSTERKHLQKRIDSLSGSSPTLVSHPGEGLF
jgi:RNA polymerase sigma-70 factor (ECF subfamily)